MGGRVLLAIAMLTFACGGESHVRDSSNGSSETGGSSSGGANATGGAAGTGAVPGGFSRDALRVIDAWSSAVTERCKRCNPAGADSCIAEDGVLVPSPFLLICLSQLAATDAEIADLLSRWASEAEASAARWSEACDLITAPPPPPQLPGSALMCATREFGCPEQTTATLCDNVLQCFVGEDERFCGPLAEVFTCHRGETFAWDRICNGVPDCEFGEDERTCPALPPQ